MKKWKINSWRNYTVKHIPTYENEKELNMVLNKIKNFPPLVFAGETRHLKEQLANVVDGKAFLLQGGDCAETFEDFKADIIRDKLKILNSLDNLYLKIHRNMLIKKYTSFMFSNFNHNLFYILLNY